MIRVMEVRNLLRSKARVDRAERVNVERPIASDDAVVAAGAWSGRFVVLESCHSTWLFDTADRRFCRVLKGGRVGSAVTTEWRPYDRLVLQDDSDAFVVFLDASGTRLLRSWRHTARCDQCGGDVTAEMSLEDLRRVARA